MYMTISRKVLKATERKKSEYYTKFNEKPLVGVKKGGDLIDLWPVSMEQLAGKRSNLCVAL